MSLAMKRLGVLFVCGGALVACGTESDNGGGAGAASGGTSAQGGGGAGGTSASGGSGGAPSGGASGAGGAGAAGGGAGADGGNTGGKTGALPLFEGYSVAQFAWLQSSCGAPTCPNGSGSYDAADPAGSSATVMRLRAVEGDASGGVVRAQALSPDILDIGGEYWDVVGVYFPDSYPHVTSWQAVYSYYGPPHAGSPPNIQAVHGDDIEYDLTVNGTRIWSRKLLKGTWMNFARRYKLSTDGSGWMEIYHSTGNEPLELQTLSNGTTLFNGPTVTAAHSEAKNDFRISNYRAAKMQGFGDVSIFYRRVSLWSGTATLADINDHYFGG